MEGRDEPSADFGASAASDERGSETTKCHQDPCHLVTHGITSDPNFSMSNMVEHEGYCASLRITRPGPLHKPVLSRCRSCPIPCDEKSLVHPKTTVCCHDNTRSAGTNARTLFATIQVLENAVSLVLAGVAFASHDGAIGTLQNDGVAPV